MRVIRFVLVFSIFVLGCPESHCPDGHDGGPGTYHPGVVVDVAYERGPSCNPASGECVACTVETEQEDCLGYSCDAAAEVCTATRLHTVSVCQPCRADSECNHGMRCAVFAPWGEDTRETVCLWEPDGHGCATSADDVQAPYSNLLTTVDAKGEPVTVCAPKSTCYATRAYVAQRPCTTVTDCSDYVGTFAGAGACIAATATRPAHCAMTCSLDGDPGNEYDGCLFGDECHFGLCVTP